MPSKTEWSLYPYNYVYDLYVQRDYNNWDLTASSVAEKFREV